MTDEVETKEVPKNIHEAIAAIYKQVGYVQKTKNANLNYSFAGEAGLINAIRPYLVEHDVYLYVKDISDVTHEWYTTDKGKQMLNTTLRAVVSFVHAPSGTSIDVTAVGEGSDTGDKSVPKATTSAYKYALRNTFCIATGDDPDNESSEGMDRKAGTTSTRMGGNGKSEKNSKALAAYAQTKGLDVNALGKALGLAGFAAFDASRWDEMIAAVDAYNPN